MNYVYDVLININGKTIDFYDWNQLDEIKQVKKVPIYKVDNKTFLDLSFKKVSLSQEELSLIKNKTMLYKEKEYNTITYALIITNNTNCVFLSFDSKGITKYKSKFLINEELEMIDSSYNLPLKKINYRIIDNFIYRDNMTREEYNITNRILNELSILKNDNKIINYLYYEWFNQKEGINKYNKLVSSIKEKYTKEHKYLLEIINLLVKNNV